MGREGGGGECCEAGENHLPSQQGSVPVLEMLHPRRAGAGGGVGGVGISRGGHTHTHPEWVPG